MANKKKTSKKKSISKKEKDAAFKAGQQCFAERILQTDKPIVKFFAEKRPKEYKTFSDEADEFDAGFLAARNEYLVALGVPKFMKELKKLCAKYGITNFNPGCGSCEPYATITDKNGMQFEFDFK